MFAYFYLKSPLFLLVVLLTITAGVSEIFLRLLLTVVNSIILVFSFILYLL